MQFTKTLIAAASVLAPLAQAANNTIEFVNQDATNRTIYFMQNPGLASIEPLNVTGNGNATAFFPDSWVGNWYSVSENSTNTKNGNLGEIAWNAWSGVTFFDVSAVANNGNDEGVKMLFPASAEKPVSGCLTTPCATQYNNWNDVATLSTAEESLICVIGNANETELESNVYNLIMVAANGLTRRHARDIKNRAYSRAFVDEIISKN